MPDVNPLSPTDDGHIGPVRRSLRRLQWMLPLVVALAASSVVMGFYVFVEWGWMLRDAADGITAVVFLVTAATLVTLHLILKPAIATLLAVLDAGRSNEHDKEQRLALQHAVNEISVELQKARRPDELAQMLLSDLARRCQAHQSLCCEWDEAQGRLRPLARFGGVGANAEEALGHCRQVGTLLEECASSRRVVVLQQPGANFLKIGSGLGEMLPASVVLLPIEHGGRLFAVLELATSVPFAEADLELLRKIQPMFAMSLDILRKAEHTEALLRAAKLDDDSTQRIMGTVADGMWSLDASGRTSFVNRYALDLLGYEEDEVLGQPIDFLALSPQAIEATLQDGELRSLQAPDFRCRDGSVLPCKGSVTGIRRGGELAGAMVVFRRAQP